MIKVGIIGCGGIASAHLEAYQLFPERCQVGALADITPGKAAKLGLDVPCFDAIEPMWDQADIDLVSICTPPSTHAELAIAALNAGKHVLLEKPMASSLEECDAMLAAQKQSGKLLSIIAQNRFQTPIARLKQVLDSGLAGDILHVQVDSFWWRGHCYYDLSWRGAWATEGGGCTLNHAVHHLDLLQWLMGLPSEVRAVMGNTAHDNAEVEDLSVAILKYPEGRLAQATSSVVHHGERQQLIFQGTKARVSFPWEVYASTSQPNGFPDRDPAHEEELQRCHDDVAPLAHEFHAGQIDHLLSAINGDVALTTDGVQGRNTLELITAIYQAATEDTTVSLPIAPDNPWYTFAGKVERAPHFFEKTAAVDDLGGGPIIVGSSERPQS